MIDINSSKINRIIIHRVFSVKDKNSRDIHELTELEPYLITFGSDELTLLKDRISKSFSRGSKFFKLQIADTQMGSFYTLSSKCKNADESSFIKYT
jgi:hypothetical protein